MGKGGKIAVDEDHFHLIVLVQLVCIVHPRGQVVLVGVVLGEVGLLIAVTKVGVIPCVVVGLGILLEICLLLVVLLVLLVCHLLLLGIYSGCWALYLLWPFELLDEDTFGDGDVRLRGSCGNRLGRDFLRGDCRCLDVRGGDRKESVV